MESMRLTELEEREMLKQDTCNLRQITNEIVNNHKKRSFHRAIEEDNNTYYDGLHLKFIQNNKELSQSDICLIEQIFEFIKNNN
ncbi:MAG: hypothetical protein ACRCVJ_11880 [Clostridium sp.]|uniref:hypothetical protein n=1 Tax=Clostridium sp. TaxID=1506 RepID=UPI003F2A8D18